MKQGKKIAMSNNSAKGIFIEYFQSMALLHDIRNYLPLPFLMGSYRITTTLTTDKVINSIRDQAKELSFSQSSFEKFLKIHIDGLVAGEKPEAAHNFVRTHCESIERKIRNIPNTLDKARDALRALVEIEDFTNPGSVYDAVVLLSDEVPSELPKKVVRRWKEEAKRHKETLRYDVIESDIFWVSHDFHESFDGIARYRLREHFGIGEFELAFAEVEAMLAEELAQGCAGIGAPIYGGAGLTPLAYDLWLVSRSRNLPNRIRDSVNIALRNIALLQSPEGWWTDCRISQSADKGSEAGLQISRYLPSTYTTALCSLNLVKLSISEPMKQKGVLGAKWLLERQNPDGSWSRERIYENGIVQTPDLFVTLLSLEAIARSGIGNVKHSIDLGLEWLMKQQNDLGMWDDQGFPFPFMTVLVLEFVKLKDYSPTELDSYLSMSRGFLNRSVQLSLEENSNSHRLAIITAFQGIEAFLYSVLSHPNVNITIFDKKKKDETIGMRKALTKFQAYLQGKGDIKRSEVVAYRNSLDSLAYLRDQVVHKGIDITQSMCRPLIDDALKFASKYSLRVFGFDIFV